MRGRRRRVLATGGVALVVLMAALVLIRLSHPKITSVGATGGRLDSFGGIEERFAGALFVPEAHALAVRPERYRGKTVVTRGTVRRRVEAPPLLVIDGALGVDPVIVLVDGVLDDRIGLWTIVEVVGVVDAMSLAQAERLVGKQLGSPLVDRRKPRAVIRASSVMRYYPLPELEQP